MDLTMSKKWREAYNIHLKQIIINKICLTPGICLSYVANMQYKYMTFSIFSNQFFKKTFNQNKNIKAWTWDILKVCCILRQNFCTKRKKLKTSRRIKQTDLSKGLNCLNNLSGLSGFTNCRKIWIQTFN